ncbi:F510_1955 family glycosylhydrolase [Arthrobacter sp.]|uniref:F510_1955 family glycosylhydrolase n=1 Tax=Arthrobacter sp. TaxID=1667 RepID=UPI003A8D940F
MPSITPKSILPRRRTGIVDLLAASALVLSACSPPSTLDSSIPVAATADYPTSHIHGMHVDAETGKVLLATHDGLYDVSTKPATRIGPDIDLMGFTVATDGTLYASGHPGPGVDMPNPVGLVESIDGGRTWTPLSRTGQSDFHALAATHEGIIGFDGQLVTNQGGSSWELAEDQVSAYHLAATTDGHVALATTESGLMRSSDHGNSWDRVPGAPLLMLTAVSGNQAAGITPDGTLYSSSDGGLQWQKRPAATKDVAAMDLVFKDGKPQIWTASPTGVKVSRDMGRTFTGLEPRKDQE